MSVYYWVEYLTDTRISDLMTYSSSYGYSLYCMVFGAIAEIAMFIMVVITYFCARSDAMRYRYGTSCIIIISFFAPLHDTLCLGH